MAFKTMSFPAGGVYYGDAININSGDIMDIHVTYEAAST
jgi:hypothetical protein